MEHPMPVDPKRVQAVFLAAVEYQDPADRSAFLDRECATDVELRRRVESLLRANDEPGSFLDQPFVGSTDRPEAEVFGADGDVASEPNTVPPLDGTTAPSGEPVPSMIARTTAPIPITEGPGNRIGPYKLLQKIGDGGM